MPELDAVLDALDCSDDQRCEAYSRINAPRAVARLRETVPPVHPAPDSDVGWFPSSGDLLRSLRLRRGLPLERVAEVLKVRACTVSRWENSRSAPDHACLESYCTLLGAEPEERQALRHLFLRLPQTQSVALPLDTLECSLEQLRQDAVGGRGHLMELRFLSLEAQLWQRTPRCPASRRLQAITHTWHAQWLLWNERRPEAGQTARRALDIVETSERPEPFWFRAVSVYAAYLASSMKRAALVRGAEFVQDWLPAARRPEPEAWMRHTIASYAVRAGATEYALEMVSRASDAIARSERATAVRIASWDSAAILVRVGRYDEACALLAPDDPRDVNVYHRAYHAIIWTEALLELGDRAGADWWYGRACEIVRRHDISPERYTIAITEGS
jgi:transcriptional regulator with XRE-family HTH domain